jgi:hypothetical protein
MKLRLNRALLSVTRTSFAKFPHIPNLATLDLGESGQIFISRHAFRLGTINTAAENDAGLLFLPITSGESMHIDVSDSEVRAAHVGEAR